MFDKGSFTREIKRLHLISDEERAYFDALEDATAEAFVDEIFDLVGPVKMIKDKDDLYENLPENIDRFKLVLGQINENYVGHTLFKLLQTKLHFPANKSDPTRKIHIINDSNHVRSHQGSEFSSRTLAVIVEFSLYEDDGAGISGREYYVIDLSAPKGNQVTTRAKSLVGSMFHELTHALHHLSGTTCKDGNGIKKSGDNIWSKKEERYTISGFRDAHEYDIICDYGFEKYNSIMQHNPALGRDGKFRPRLGHIKCKGISNKRTLIKLNNCITDPNNNIDAIIGATSQLIP
jgi:hypothetical protein